MKRRVVSLAAGIALLCGRSAFSQDAPEPEPPTADARTGAPEARGDPELPPGEAMRRVDEALAKLSDEPSLADLERAALKRAEADAGSVERLKRAVRGAAALPTIKLSLDRDQSRGENLDRYQDEPDRWGADTDRGLGIGVSAEWKLGELVFDPDEIRVYDLLGDRADRREALLSLLVGTFFERRRLMLTELLLPAATPDEAIERRMRIDELTAVIDALTGGDLSRNLKGKSTRSHDHR